MNTNSIVDRQDYYDIKGIDHYFIYNGDLYHGDKKDSIKSWKKITSPFDIEFDDICEVRDFLEAFHYYPDTENDYLFHKDIGSYNDKCIAADEVISFMNMIYIALENPKTNKFMIIPCTACYHDESDRPDDDDDEFRPDCPNISLIESTKRDITDSIVAYDNKTCNKVIFIGISEDCPLRAKYGTTNMAIHVVDEFKIERIADFSYKDEMELYTTISHWFSEKTEKSKVSSKKVSSDITVITYGMMDATPKAEEKPVTITRAFISNKKHGDHDVFYVSYKNPGDEYITMYQVDTDAANLDKFIDCYNYIKDNLEV